MNTITLQDVPSYERKHLVQLLTADAVPLEVGRTYWDGNGDACTVESIDIERYQCRDSGDVYIRAVVHAVGLHKVRWNNLYSFNPKKENRP